MFIINRLSWGAVLSGEKQLGYSKWVGETSSVKDFLDSNSSCLSPASAGVCVDTNLGCLG